tara:strand:- start:22 stop:384 length:363 start_codon:yes stop_codon:yes gene_type:complete
MKKHFWKLSTILWICIILYLSFFTTVDPNGLPIFENQDKVGHFLFYAILTAVLIKTFSVELIKNPPIFIAIVFAFFFGAVIEILQHYATEDRFGSIWDLIFNTLGILIIGFIAKKRLNGN